MKNDHLDNFHDLNEIKSQENLFPIQNINWNKNGFELKCN